jgi:hypothetical protein
MKEIMSKIKCTFDLTNNSWMIQKVLIIPGTATVDFFIKSESQYTSLQSFEVGFDLFKNGGVCDTFRRTFPPNTEFDESAFLSQPILLEKVSSYKIKFYYVINGQEYEQELLFEVGMPPKPYESWKLVDNNWEPPVPCPAIGMYTWNEASQQWDQITDVVYQR